MPKLRWFPWVALALSLAPSVLSGQATLTLAGALERARDGAWANRIAAAEARARTAEALAPYKGILPSIRLESGYIATTDPLGAFGFTLRQRSVTPAAFAPDRLNHPPTTHGVGTSVVLEQPLLNPDAWLGRKAAGSAGAAARAAAEWTRSGTAVEVVRTYWGAVLAAEEVTTLKAADQAAQAHQRQAESLVRQGMATRSDALLAEVKAGEVRAQLLGAQSRARLSRLGLAMVLGSPDDTAFVLPVALPLPADTGDQSQPAEGPRADVTAATHALAAARANASRARSLYLPRLNGFGRLEWNTPGTPFGGKSAWTLGLMVSWAPFSGAAELADQRSSRARSEAAGAVFEAATARAAFEASTARETLLLALARLDIATSTALQAAEAHRIVGRKYEGGLATVTDLFDAAVTQTASELARSAARYDALVARAELDRASGRSIQ